METMIVENNTSVVTKEKIQQLIYVVRGKQVMLDSNLADLYQVETGNLNKAMKRNQKRFPEEFCFQLTKEEYENLIFQNGSSSEKEHGGRRKLPYVYTEQGIAMLSAVLRSDIAIQVSIQIMKTFVELRKYLSHNALLLEKMNSLEIRQIESERKFLEFEQKTEKKTGVNVCIYALPNARISNQDINNFNQQYPMLEVKRTTAFHDRFMIIDGNKGFHIGASIKDAGKKCFGINRIEDVGVLNDLVQRAQLTATT